MKNESDSPNTAPLAEETAKIDAQDVSTQMKPDMGNVSETAEGNERDWKEQISDSECVDVTRAPPMEDSHVEKSTATYVAGFPGHQSEMQTMDKDEALLGHPREEQNMTPGAIAIPGTGANEEEELDGLASSVPSDLEGPVSANESQTTVIVEATAVQEVVATQVVTEQSGDVVPPSRPEQPVPVGAIQHVQIDAGDDSRDLEQRPKPEGRQIKRHHVAMVVMAVVIVYTIKSYCLSTLAPSRQQIEADRKEDREVDDCLLAQEDLIYWLERLLLFVRIDVGVAIWINTILTYRLFDWCQDKYCRDSTPIVRGEFYVSLVLVLFEFMNLIVGSAFIVLMAAHELQDPAELLRYPCETNSAAFRTITEVDEIGDLRVSFAATNARATLLLIVIFLRVRLVLLKNETLQRSPSKRRAVNCIMVLIDVLALALASVSIWQLLVVLDEVKAYDPT